MKRQQSNDPSKLASTEGSSKGNTNTKPVFFSNSKCQVSPCQPPLEPNVEVFWHCEGKISPELKSVFAMLLRGLK